MKIVSRLRPGWTNGKWATIVFAGLILVGACDGGNVFTGDGAESKPQILSLSLPQVAHAGDKATIRVDAFANFGISQVLIAFRGAVNRDTTVSVNSTAPRLSQIVTLTLPMALQDTLLFVQATVIDRRGGVSGVREGQIVVFGPPTITGLSAPSIVRLGELISVRVSAFAARNITQIDLTARGALHKDTTVAVSPPRPNVTQDIVIPLPTEARDTTITLAVGVRDAVGQGGQVVSRTIPIVIEPPVVEITTPAMAHAGLNLDVQVHASGMRPIGQIRVELRGAHVADVNVTISPSQTDFIRNVSIPLPPTIVLSDLRVRAAVVDRGQVVSYSAENLVTIPLGQPGIISLEAPLQAYGGKVVDIRVRAQGDRPISKVEVRYRGVVDSTKVYTVSPIQTSVIQDSWVGLPPVTADAVLTILATVTDVSGAVSEIVSTNVSVIPAPEPEPAFELSFAPTFRTTDPPWARSAFRILANPLMGAI